MKKPKHLILFGIIIGSILAAGAQNANKIDNPKMLDNNARHNIQIPLIDGFVALKCDFHLHTMFSDGLVWPTVRVTEAYRDGLDAIAITDHIEYRPYKKYITGDLNASYDLAKLAADKHGVILVKATEITRDKPIGGHLNALFIKDANPLDNKDIEVQINEAHKQGAYIIWNHPGWAVDSCIMYEPNKRWIEEGKVQAVEVFNEKEYYPRATTWVRDMKLAAMACSDAHPPIELLYAHGVRRPITLVFAKDRTLEALREAMFAGRTLAWFNDELVGKADMLEKLFKASVHIERGENKYKMTNISDIAFSVKLGQTTTIVAPQTTMEINIPRKMDTSKGVQIELTNLHTSENTNLIVNI